MQPKQQIVKRNLLSSPLGAHQLLICFTSALQGFSTGLPERLQLALLRTLPGLENCSMLRPAYAVEYDYLPAHQCFASLETKKFKGLFFSGQLNGTTGVCWARETVEGKICRLALYCTVLYGLVACYGVQVQPMNGPEALVERGENRGALRVTEQPGSLPQYTCNL
jgi:hypothetical protein